MNNYHIQVTGSPLWYEVDFGVLLNVFIDYEIELEPIKNRENEIKITLKRGRVRPLTREEAETMLINKINRLKGL